MAHVWTDIGSTTQLDAAGRLSCSLDNVPIGVFVTGSGVYAVDDRCPHGLGKLSSGRIDGDTIECPLHTACFSLKSGECLFGGDWTLKCYPARISNGRIEIMAQSNSRICGELSALENSDTGGMR